MFSLTMAILIFLDRWTMTNGNIQPLHPKDECIIIPRRSAFVQPKRRKYSLLNQCPYCLDDLKYELEINCGHRFCCPCFIGQWANSSYIGAITCPYCRTEAKFVYQSFSEAELFSGNKSEAKKVDEFLTKVHAYNDRRYGIIPKSSQDIAETLRPLNRRNTLIWILLRIMRKNRQSYTVNP